LYLRSQNGSRQQTLAVVVHHRMDHGRERTTTACAASAKYQQKKRLNWFYYFATLTLAQAALDDRTWMDHNSKKVFENYRTAVSLSWSERIDYIGSWP
jgi:hypothetical protein